MTFSLPAVSSLVVWLSPVSFGGAGAIIIIILPVPDSDAFRSVGQIDLDDKGVVGPPFRPTVVANAH
jgi:hypothetical protein